MRRDSAHTRGSRAVITTRASGKVASASKNTSMAGVSRSASVAERKRRSIDRRAPRLTGGGAFPGSHWPYEKSGRSRGTGPPPSEYEVSSLPAVALNWRE